jgi:hypothetical protein
LITAFIKSAHTSLFTNTQSMCARRLARQLPEHDMAAMPTQDLPTHDLPVAADLHGGRGGYWEDRGYEWCAVI